MKRINGFWKRCRSGMRRRSDALSAAVKVTRFLFSHSAITNILADAVGNLGRSFGQDIVVALDVVDDDRDHQSLYVIVMWRGSAEDAEAHLEDFEERWWLNQPAQPGLTFTYELIA